MKYVNTLQRDLDNECNCADGIVYCSAYFYHFPPLINLSNSFLHRPPRSYGTVSTHATLGLGVSLRIPPSPQIIYNGPGPKEPNLNH